MSPRQSPTPYVNPTLEGLYAETRPGCCAMCDGPLPQQEGIYSGRKRRICKHPECLRLYNQIYRIDRVKRVATTPEQQQERLEAALERRRERARAYSATPAGQEGLRRRYLRRKARSEVKAWLREGGVL